MKSGMPPEIKILQSVTPPQIEEARTLFREYASALGFDLEFQDFDKELAQLPGEYAPPTGRLFLVYVDGVLAGCVALHAMGKGICEMKRMYVRPGNRGLGLGRKLAVKCIEEARTIGYRALRLDTIATMTEAMALYRSLEFAEIAPYRFNPVAGALYMELAL
jgi:putative acetyltransferase